MSVLDLTDFFTTKSEANDFAACLAKVSSNIYEIDQNLEKILQEQLGLKKKEKFMTTLRDNNIPLDSNQKLTKFMEKIIEEISSLPEATLTIAVEPDNEMLKTISDWFLLNLKKQILIKTIVNPDLVAGATVDFQGNHAEFTIDKVLKSLYPAENQNLNQEEKTEQEDTKEQKRYYVETQDNLQIKN